MRDFYGPLVEECLGCKYWHRGRAVSHNHCDDYPESHTRHIKANRGPQSNNEVNDKTGKFWCWTVSFCFDW